MVDYLLECHRQDPAKTTFKLTQYALRLFFRETLGRDWKLFKKMKPLRQKRLPKALSGGLWMVEGAVVGNIERERCLVQGSPHAFFRMRSRVILHIVVG